MKLYRLAKVKYSNDLSGKGAELSGGRWNSKGVPILYTSSSIALATTEIAVHVPLGILPKGYVSITIDIPESIQIEELATEGHPVDWRSIPHSNSTQIIGDNFISNAKTLILKVPSAVVQGDYNYLLNPQHPEIAKVKIKEILPYEFDKRLFVRS